MDGRLDLTKRLFSSPSTFHAPVSVCVWGVEERRKPLSLRDSSGEGLLESQDQYLLIYILAQIREWNSGGRESVEGWRQRGRKR